MLRSIRYGEADRVLHLYTADRGRVGAVAKGVRRVKSRLGGRLEPLSRVRLVHAPGPRRALHDQPGGHGPRPRGPAASTGRRSSAAPRRARRCCACSTRPSRTRPPTTCSATSSRCSTTSPDRASRAQALAFRLKLLLAAGFAPELASCAACGEAEHLGAFSPSAGGVVCAGCEAGSFPLGRGGAQLPRGRARPPARRGPRRARARAPAGRPRAGGDDGVPRARSVAPRGVAQRAQAGRFRAIDSPRGGQARLRLRRGLARHARAARGQGRQRRRDDARARRRARARRLHDHDRGLHRLHAAARACRITPMP